MAGDRREVFGWMMCLYEISNRGTSWIGFLILGLVVSATNSYRQALLSLIALFVIGSALLALTDTRRAIREVGQPEGDRSPESACDLPLVAHRRGHGDCPRGCDARQSCEIRYRCL